MNKTLLKKIDWQGLKIIVSNRGKIYNEEGKELKQTKLGFGKLKYMYVNTYASDSKTKILINVARAICMAFHPIEGYEFEDYSALQADHIDSNSLHNVQSNIRWVSRQFNNSRRHAKLLREINRKMTTHKQEYVKAVSETGEVKYFINGRQAAKWIGCSTPYVYMCLQKKVAGVMGWTLEFVSIYSDEVKEFRELVEKERNDRIARRKKIDGNRRQNTLREKIWLANLVRKEQMKFCRDNVMEWSKLAQNIASLRREVRVVQQIDPKTKDVVKEWDCVYSAQKELHLPRIRDCVKSGVDGAMTGGFIWRYKIPREGLEFCEIKTAVDESSGN